MTQEKVKTKGKAGAFEKTLGRVLKNIRVSLGYNQEDIANKIGVTFQQVQKYEGGTNRIPLYNFLKMCSFFKVDPQEVIGSVEESDSSFSLGFAEDEQTSFDNDYFTRPETGALLREYYKIFNPEKRKQILHIIKTFQESE